MKKSMFRWSLMDSSATPVVAHLIFSCIVFWLNPLLAYVTKRNALLQPALTIDEQVVSADTSIRSLPKAHSLVHSKKSIHSTKLTHSFTPKRSLTHSIPTAHSIQKAHSLQKAHSFTTKSSLTQSLEKAHLLPRACSPWKTLILIIVHAWAIIHPESKSINFELKRTIVILFLYSYSKTHRFVAWKYAKSRSFDF